MAELNIKKAAVKAIRDKVEALEADLNMTVAKREDLQR